MATLADVRPRQVKAPPVAPSLLAPYDEHHRPLRGSIDCDRDVEGLIATLVIDPERLAG